MPSMLDHRRWWLRKRVLVPSLLAAFGTVAAFRFLAPAVAVDRVIAEPDSAADGVRAQVIERDGRPVVRCAVLVDAHPDRVWDVLTDYDRFTRVFPMLEEVRVQRETGDAAREGAIRISGIARTPIGRLEFSTRVQHDLSAARRASWNEPGGALTVNKGSWTVHAAAGGSHVEYVLDVSVNHFPDLIVRAAVLALAPDVVNAAIAAARQEGSR